MLLIIWRQYRKHFAGLWLLLVDMLLQTIGFLLILLRGTIPDFISIVIANACIITGALFVLIGLEYFFDKKKKNIHNYILIAVFLCALTYFSIFHSDLTVREIIISIMTITINTQTCYLIFRRVDSNLYKIARLTGITLAAYNVVSFFRIIFLFVFPTQTNVFFKSGLIGSMAMAIFMVLSILITMSFILLVNRRLLEETQTQKEKYNTTFNSSPYAIILTRISDGKIFEVNEGFERISGHQPSDVIGKTTLSINLWLKEEDRLVVVNELSRGNEVRDLEMQFRVKSGKIITGLISSKIVMINDEICVLTSISDITEISLIRQQLHDLSLHDVLTGLPNRKLFYDRFENAKANAQRKNNKLAIITLDLDFLKLVNDQLGHETGDHVLVAISNRLTGLLRKVDTIARFGGDEFVLLLWEIDNKLDAIKIIKSIQDCLSEPINIDEKVVNITSSIGVALYPEDGIDINVLMKKSDDSMYHVKKNGRNNFMFYDDLK